MEKRFLVIKDAICRIVVKRWSFDLALFDDVTKKAPTIFNDFCSVNDLNSTKFFWEITK